MVQIVVLLHRDCVQATQISLQTQGTMLLSTLLHKMISISLFLVKYFHIFIQYNDVAYILCFYIPICHIFIVVLASALYTRGYPTFILELRHMHKSTLCLFY